MYFSLVGRDGRTYLFDFAVPNQVAISDEEGNAIIISNSGIRPGDAACSVGTEIHIDNLFAQLAAHAQPVGRRLANNSRPAKRSLVQIDFTAIAELTDSCGAPSSLGAAKLYFGPFSCAVQDDASSVADGRFQFDCQYPGANSNLAACVTAFEQSASQLGELVAVLANLDPAGFTVGWLSANLETVFAVSEIAGPVVADAVAMAAAIWAVSCPPILPHNPRRKSC